jgi:hypothetical protein
MEITNTSRQGSYVPPPGASRIIPSGVNYNASYHSKGFLLIIHVSTNINPLPHQGLWILGIG